MLSMTIAAKSQIGAGERIDAGVRGFVPETGRPYLPAESPNVIK
jgi:hypothetical protein